jgi:hypothetical protein
LIDHAFFVFRNEMSGEVSVRIVRGTKQSRFVARVQEETLDRLMRDISLMRRNRVHSL